MVYFLIFLNYFTPSKAIKALRYKRLLGIKVYEKKQLLKVENSNKTGFTEK